MAGDWIPVRTNIHDDPAVLGISMQTGLDEDSVVGKLLRIWGWAQGQTVSGVVPNVTAEWINRRVNRTGFAEAMSAQGWLCLRTGTIEIPKFERWLGKGAKRRLLDTQRKNLVRKMSASCPQNVRSTEEKKREEKEESPPKPPQGGERRVKKPKQILNQEQMESFEIFWESYPRREARARAERAFAKINPDEAKLQTIMAAIEKQKVHGCLENLFGPDGRSLIPHPASWLNARRWEDKPIPPVHANGKTTHSQRMDNLWESLKRKDADAQS